MHLIINYVPLLRRSAFVGLAILAGSPIVMVWLLPARPVVEYRPALEIQPVVEDAGLRDDGVIARQPDLGDPSAPPLVFEIRGRDFRWHFRELPAPETQTSLTRGAGEHVLRLPVGARVEFHLTSDDYVYFLSIPELGIRQIAVPGMTHIATCEISEPLTRDLRVDALCNFPFYHDEWMGRIVALTRTSFATSGEVYRNES